VKYVTATAFRRALEDRLLARGNETGLALSRLRKEVAFDRLLARLLDVAPGRWVLKGGLALDYRFGDRARTTRDVDVAMAGGEEGATAALLDAQTADLGDFFVFTIERTARLDELEEGAAVRYHARAELAGRLFEEFVVDVGFDTPPAAGVEVLRGPDLLGFAEIPPIEAPALALELQVAEKLHAYTRNYGQAGVQSTRVKDLVDLVLIATSRSLDAATLRSAVDHTFAGRGLHGVPEALPEPPADWRVPFRRMANEVGLDEDLDAGHQVACLLVDPILDGSTPRGAWDPVRTRWTT
jgi:predicted nucleotidyltransferase component of viral defense system